MFALLQGCWSTDPNVAMSGLLDCLFSLGKQLVANRSPYYNVIRALVGENGLILETEMLSDQTRSTLEDATTPRTGSSFVGEQRNVTLLR
jgi:hypothetical protein